MEGWDVDRAMRWLVAWLLTKPAAQIDGVGEIVSESLIGKDGPPWPIAKQGMALLIADGYINGKPEYLWGGDGSPDYYRQVKFTASGLRKLSERRAEIGFDSQ